MATVHVIDRRAVLVDPDPDRRPTVMTAWPAEIALRMHDKLDRALSLRRPPATSSTRVLNPRFVS